MTIKKLIETGYIDDVKYEIYKARNIAIKEVTYEVTFPKESRSFTRWACSLNKPSTEDVMNLINNL